MDLPRPEGPTKYSQSADSGIVSCRIHTSRQHLFPPACISLLLPTTILCPPGAVREPPALHPTLGWLSLHFLNQ